MKYSKGKWEPRKDYNMSPNYKCPKCNAVTRLLDTLVAPTPNGRLGSACPKCGELLKNKDRLVETKPQGEGETK